MDELILERFERNGEVYLFLDVPFKNAIVEDIGDTSDSWDVYWNYLCTGLHKGIPLKIAIKNSRFEPDSDGESMYYSFTHDGFYFVDDLTELPDEIYDFYAGAICDAAMLCVGDT